MFDYSSDARYPITDCANQHMVKPETISNEKTIAHPESESELFTGDTSKDNHSPGPVFREVSP